MNKAINEHTKTLIDELMRSLSIQQELLCELEKMMRMAADAGDDYAEQRYLRALSRRSNV
ncbi:MAG: hypothetical protein E7670_01155 [Ruminococcaceae bacterium]|nr:hypothetical protein [Oscillospiraceae bacterium]